MKSNVILLGGNGFIGHETARALAHEGCGVVVLHTGSRRVPAIDNVQQVLAPASPLPIVHFPAALRSQAEDAVVVHFQCMGRPDAEAFLEAFDGVARRLVLISSADVYRSYGLFTGIEEGGPEVMPMNESAPLRTRRFPYRGQAKRREDLLHWYEKIDAEFIVGSARSPWTILRLPKVYRETGSRALQTVYGFRHHPLWRWTHGHVANIAAAISTAALSPEAAGEVFNLGEETTPTVAERLALLPPRPDIQRNDRDGNFQHDLHVDRNKIRRVLGYRDAVDESRAMQSVANAAARLPE